MENSSRNMMTLLMTIWKSPEETESKLRELQRTIFAANSHTTKQVQMFFFATINAVLNRCTENTNTEKNLKRLITDILKVYFDKTKVDSLNNFFFVYNFLLGEIYDQHQQNSVAAIEEEYKLAIMQTMISLTKALTWDVVKALYTREHALALCQMLYTIIEMAKCEKLRILRCACIECIMALAKVDGTIENTDIEIRNQIADVFMFFAPGIISGLGAIAVEDEKSGHNIALLAIRAWGRIIALQMQNYNASPDDSNSSITTELECSLPKTKWKDKEQVKEYVENAKRNASWYRTSDNHLQASMSSIVKLTRHSHPKVRVELAESCLLLVKHCSTSIPRTVSKIIEILIILSEDEDKEVAATSNLILGTFSNNFASSVFKSVLESLEENFFTAITALPRIFSGFDKREQLSGLNLLIGYIRLFGKTYLAQLLHSTTHLKRLIQTIIQICELDRKDVALYEEYTIQDLEFVVDHRTPWKNFRYFRKESVETRFEVACSLLAECDALDMVSDLLLEIFMNCEENRKEATLILNSLLSGAAGNTFVYNSMHVVKAVVNTYLDPQYWNLPLEVSHKCMMPQVQNNIIQICLQVEGLSKIALAIKSQFTQFLLKALYPILERAGAGHPLIKAAGTTAIVNVSIACGYINVTELINANSDYFSYHVLNRIHKIEENESVLNVLATVMKYSNIDVLPSISDIVCGVLLQTCDKFFLEQNANAYLRLFQMFIKCLIRWLCVEIDIKPIKSKLQKELEHEAFQISNLHIENEDDDTDAGKSAEDMYKEDMENWQHEMNEDFEIPVEEYEKPEPPKYIMLVVKLLQRCLNFLPSKDRTRKLLVLEILTEGLELIRDWENDLLPLVHQIWSPLAERFKEKDDTLIINRSFQLLVTLARLSKDFIRSRTTKDALPRITAMLVGLSKSSYLQDRGSAYRYTQAYKMQLNVVQQLARVIIDIDLSDALVNSTMEAIVPYLSNRQPIPLQEAAMGFYCDLAIFDQSLVRTILQKVWNEESHIEKSEYARNVEAVLGNIM